MSPIRPKIDDDPDATMDAEQGGQGGQGDQGECEYGGSAADSGGCEYMALLEAGVHPNRHEFISRFPEIATELAKCLDGLAFVHSAAAQMQAPAMRRCRG